MTAARPFAGSTGNVVARGAYALLALLLLALATFASAAPTFPPLTGRVVDAANVLPPATVAELTAKLEALETATGTQLVVATVPSLQDNDISDYAYQLGRAWGIGQKGTNNGVVLLVAPVERKVWIATGYGMEERLTDSLSETIIQRNILPGFKAGDLPGGIVAGTDALIAQLQLPPGEARAQVAAATVQPRAKRHSGSAGGFIWLGIVLLWLFFSMFRGRRGRSSGLGNAILWGVASSVLNSGSRGSSWGGGGGSDWGGGGGGGGGGFSGGGGSFGGGGAGGSW